MAKKNQKPLFDETDDHARSEEQTVEVQPKKVPDHTFVVGLFQQMSGIKASSLDYVVAAKLLRKFSLQVCCASVVRYSNFMTGLEYLISNDFQPVRRLLQSNIEAELSRVTKVSSDIVVDQDMQLKRPCKRKLKNNTFRFLRNKDGKGKK